jgi:hypothetical protein
MNPVQSALWLQRLWSVAPCGGCCVFEASDEARDGRKKSPPGVSLAGFGWRA